MAEYSVEFWTLAADSKWNEEAIQGAFVNGLNDSVKDELATRDEPSDLFCLVSLAISWTTGCESGAGRGAAGHIILYGLLHHLPLVLATPPGG